MWLRRTYMRGRSRVSGDVGSVAELTVRLGVEWLARPVPSWRGFATYSSHGFISDRDGEMQELEADRRRHAG